MQLHADARHRIVIGAKERGHDGGGGERPITDVQLGVALARDRAHFRDGVTGVLENGARFIEKSAAGFGQADRFGGAFE